MTSPQPTQSADQGFYRLLTEDVTVALARLEAHDSPLHRRELVRAIFAAVEGALYRVKDGISAWVRQHPAVLSAADIAILREEQYSVDERGTSHVRPLLVPLPANVRFLVRLSQRLPGVAYEVDFSHSGWNNLQASLKVRHRLTHPKRVVDLDVTKDEVGQALSGFIWLLALCLEVFETSNDALEAYQARLTAAAQALGATTPPR